RVLLVAIPLLLGVLFGSSHPDPPFAASALAVTWTLAAIATWWSIARTSAGARASAAAAVALTCAGCLIAGVLLGARARRAAERPPLLAWFAQNGGAERPVPLIRRLAD